MIFDDTSAGKQISTILKHDRKTNTYKIALLRAINDIALSYPAVGLTGQDVAVPLRLIAEYWVAYYWSFVNGPTPIPQGFAAAGKQDMSFRREILALGQQWTKDTGLGFRASDGFFLIQDLRSAHGQKEYSEELHRHYQRAIRSVKDAILQPIKYAGPGEYAVFQRPVQSNLLPPTVQHLPNTDPQESCLVIPADLWQTFLRMSLWVEALCIHEWSLYIEHLRESEVIYVDRGTVYMLLTDRPDNRRPLTWERNHINLLMMEGYTFVCPWTEHPLTVKHYNVDHIVPLALYPTNELWNLVPTLPSENRSKSDRLPSSQRMQAAKPYLVQAYTYYQASSDLAHALERDVLGRFLNISPHASDYPEQLVQALSTFVEQISESRNISRY